jgi:DNA-binding NtrC family response regulator
MLESTRVEKNMEPGILIVEDDEVMREVLSWEARELSPVVDSAADGKRGLSLFDPHRHQLVLCDLRMPGADGLEVLREINQRAPETLVVIITAYGDIPTAVAAMKAGAYDFIPKPFEREHLRNVLKKALETLRLRKKVADLEERLEWGERALIYSSPAMHRAVELADRVASSDAPVLLVGESGTGKELLARRIHARSGRRGQAFVAINCGAIPRELLEAELFGHVKGAFTGALRDRPGRFAQADGGTLFLDEIGELALDLQPKLLRVLEEGELPVLGLDGSRKVDVRILAATSRELDKLVKEGKFRGDLFYRLNVVQIRLPALRGRREDIPLLAAYFIRKWGEGRKLEIEPGALDFLGNYSWPGNVRELENFCRRLCLLAGGEIIGKEFVSRLLAEAKGVQEENPPVSNGQGLHDIEKRLIERTLRQCGYNQTLAAKKLGIPRHVLIYRMKKFQIPTRPPADKDGGE